MSIQLFDGSPFRILVGRERGWGAVSYLTKAISQQLGLENSEISLTGVSTEDTEISVRQFGSSSTGFAVRPSSTGMYSVQMSYINNTTGELGTASFFIEGVDGTELVSDKDADFLLDGLSNSYAGYDIFVTEEEIRSMYNDGTSETNNLEIKVTGGGFRSAGVDPNADVYLVEDGVWGIRQEDYAGRADKNSNLVYFFYTVTDPDTGESFSDFSRQGVKVAPSGYTPEYTLDEATDPIVSDSGINFYDEDSLIEAGVEGVDFWYDGAISPNFNQDAFWYRGGAPLEEGGDSKYWFKFKNTDTTDVLTGGGEYALVATKRDALDNGASLDSLTGEYVFSKSFVSPDGIRLYAGIDEAAIQELSNGGAEDIEVYRWDVAAGQIVGTDGREILGGRLDNRFDTIGEEYAGSLSELNNNAYSDTLA